MRSSRRHAPPDRDLGSKRRAHVGHGRSHVNRYRSLVTRCRAHVDQRRRLSLRTVELSLVTDRVAHSLGQLSRFTLHLSPLADKGSHCIDANAAFFAGVIDLVADIHRLDGVISSFIASLIKTSARATPLRPLDDLQPPARLLERTNRHVEIVA